MRLAFATALVLALMAACSRGTAADPQDLVRQSLANMIQLRSYRLEMELNGQFAGAMEFMAPGRYRFLTPAGGQGGVVETVWTVEFQYFRRCQAEGQGCEPWQKGLPTTIPMGAPGSMSIYVPGWPLTLLELAHELQTTGQEVAQGQEQVQVEGRLNHIRAFLENLRRAYAQVGRDTFGEECTEGEDGTRHCRPITFQDLLDRQKEALDYYEAHPATVRAWIGREDERLYRLELEVPPSPGESRPATVTARYTQFQGVEIDIPIVFSTPPVPTP